MVAFFLFHRLWWLWWWSAVTTRVGGLQVHRPVGLRNGKWIGIVHSSAIWHTSQQDSDRVLVVGGLEHVLFSHVFYTHTHIYIYICIYIYTYWETSSQMTHMFQRGWNHQAVRRCWFLGNIWAGNDWTRSVEADESVDSHSFPGERRPVPRRGSTVVVDLIYILHVTFTNARGTQMCAMA